MVSIETLSRYPFLKEAKEYVRNNKITVEELLENPLYERARVIGIERLGNAFDKRDSGSSSAVTETDQIMELMSYPIARMIAVCIEDIYFKRRYALGEAVHTYKNLINESTPFLMKVANEFGLNINIVEESEMVRIYFVDYLRYAPTRYKEWKMINRGIRKGYIEITNRELARLIQEALRIRINNELDNKNCNKRIYTTFLSDIQRIRKIVSSYRKNLEAEPIGKLDMNKLPPCMKRILAAMKAGENVPHVGRFAIVSFLNSLKLSTNDILRIFSTAPDYEEDKTRYQVEHITGTTSSTSYKPPGCEKMKTYGICSIGEIDDLCKRKNHPLSYYKEKWFREKKKK